MSRLQRIQSIESILAATGDVERASAFSGVLSSCRRQRLLSACLMHSMTCSQERRDSPWMSFQCCSMGLSRSSVSVSLSCSNFATRWLILVASLSSWLMYASFVAVRVDMALARFALVVWFCIQYVRVCVVGLLYVRGESESLVQFVVAR